MSNRKLVSRNCTTELSTRHLYQTSPPLDLFPYTAVCFFEFFTKELKSFVVFRLNTFDVCIRHIFSSFSFRGSIPQRKHFRVTYCTCTTVHADVPLNGIELLVSLEHNLCKYIRQEVSIFVVCCPPPLPVCLLLVLSFTLQREKYCVLPFFFYVGSECRSRKLGNRIVLQSIEWKNRI